MDIADNPVPILPPSQPNDLSECKIPATGFSALCNALSRNTVLNMFVCQGNSIRNEGAVALAHSRTRALAHVLNAWTAWTAIRQLDLELCEVGDAGRKAFIGTAELSPTLHRDTAAHRAELSVLEGLPEEERGSDPDRIKCPDRRDPEEERWSPECPYPPGVRNWVAVA
jgi:hypothetical protein